MAAVPKNVMRSKLHELLSDDDKPVIEEIGRHTRSLPQPVHPAVSLDGEGSSVAAPTQTSADEEARLMDKILHLNDVFEEIRAKYGMQNVSFSSSEEEEEEEDSEHEESNSGSASSSAFDNEPPVKRMKTAKSETASDSDMASDAASASTVKLKAEIKDEWDSEWTSTSSSSESGESLTDQPFIPYDPTFGYVPYKNPNAELLGVPEDHVPEGFMLPHQLAGRFEAAQIFRHLTKRQLKEEREYFLKHYLKKEEASSSDSSSSRSSIKMEAKEEYDSDAEYKPYREEPNLKTVLPRLSDKQINHHKGLNEEHRKILRMAWTKPHLLPVRVAEVFEVEQKQRVELNGIYRLQRGICLNGRPVYIRDHDSSRENNKPFCVAFAKNRWRILDELDETALCWAMKFREDPQDDYSSYAPYHFPNGWLVIMFEFRDDDELKFGRPEEIMKNVGGPPEPFKRYWEGWVDNWEEERVGWDEQRGKTKTDLECLPTWFKLGFRNAQHHEVSLFCTRAAAVWARQCKKMHKSGENIGMDNICCFPGFFVPKKEQWSTMMYPGTTTPIPCIYRLDQRGRFFYFKFSRQLLIAAKERILQNRKLRPSQKLIMDVKMELNLEDRVGPHLYYDRIFDEKHGCTRRMNEDEAAKKKRAEIESNKTFRSIQREEREERERMVKLEQSGIVPFGQDVKASMFAGLKDIEGRPTKEKTIRRVQGIQSGSVGVSWYQQEKKAMAKGTDPRNTHRWQASWREYGNLKTMMFPLRHRSCLSRGDYQAAKKCAVNLAIRKRRQMVAQPHVKQINQYGHPCEVQSGVKGVVWNKRYKVWQATLQLGGIKKKETYKIFNKIFNPKHFVEDEDASPLDPGPINRAKNAAIAQRREWESEHFAFATTKTLVTKEQFAKPLAPQREACPVQSGVTGVSWHPKVECWGAHFKPKNKKMLQKTFNPRKHVWEDDASHLDPGPMNLAKKEAIKQRKEWEKQYSA